MTNLLGSDRIPALTVFFDRLGEYATVRLVLSLRRLDEQMQSMYLHETLIGLRKAGIEDYLNVHRMNFGRSLLTGVARLREHYPLALVRYRNSSDFWDELGEHLGVAGLAALIAQSPRIGRSMTLKAHSLLANLESAAEALDTPLDRRRVADALRQGKLSFDNDSTSFRVVPRSFALKMNSIASEAARELGVQEYLDWFGHSRLKPYRSSSLTLDHLNRRDRERLRAWAAIDQTTGHR